MSEILVKNILEVIKQSNDKNVILKALVKLRTDIVKDREGIILFRDCDGISAIVRLLNRPHEKILEVALSILGNCCTDQICCNQAIENKIILPLITILKSVPNPLVQCRGCRLLGNLAKDNKSHLINHSITISQSLCMIIEETTDVQTTLMAIRAAKFLLIDKSFSKNFIKSNGFKILINILIKFIKNPNTDSNNDDKLLNDNITDECDQSIGHKSCKHDHVNYFDDVVRNLEGVRSDVFDAYMLRKSQKREKNNNFILPKDKTINDIINEILKCIQIISENYINPLVFLRNDNTNNLGPAPIFSCISFFIKENHSGYRSMALKIISNFFKNCLVISESCSGDVITAACEILTADNLNPPLTESDIRNCIHIICVLAGDACNRAKIRTNGALEKLIERAKTTNSCMEITMILFAFNHFQFDILSTDLLLRDGLVGILIKELDAYLNSTDKYRKEKCEDKQKMSRKRKAKKLSEKCYKNPKIWSSMFESDSPPQSTSSQSNISPPSPCSSRSMSPINIQSKTYCNEDESDSYSPVCSSDESDSADGVSVLNNCKKDKSPENNDLLEFLDDILKNETTTEEPLSDKEEDEETSQNMITYKLPSSTANHPTSAIDIIDNLLLRATIHGNYRCELGKPESLKTIFQAIKVFGVNENSFANSFYNILIESRFFVPILKQDVIHQIYLLSKMKEMKFVARNLFEALTNVAESGYGRGELTRFLSKNDLDMQKRAAIAVSFIIKTPKILYNLLTENGALYVLINTILCKGEHEEYCYEAADGITSLSKLLGIEIPECDRSVFNEKHEFDESIMNFSNMTTAATTTTTTTSTSTNTNNKLKKSNDNDNEMKFILHRGCSKIPIKFKKHLLTECSDVFNSMLNSDFKECNEGEIHLKGYSVNGIKYFLNLIHLKSINQSLNIPPIYYYESLLEAYELSRMYMMKELEIKLFNMILYRLCAKTCLKTLEWSIKNFNPELTEIIINYYLSSDIDNKDKVELYREADYCDHSKEWYQMIIDAILVKCQNLCIEG